MTYAALACKSNFSFLEGASHPEELVEAGHAQGLTALALCDRDGIHGVVRAHVRAKELGFKLVLGAEVSIDDGTAVRLLVESRQGHRNLCRLLTLGRRRSKKGTSSVAWAELCSHAEGLILLWGGPRSALLAKASPVEIASLLADAFGDRRYALLFRHRRAVEVPMEARLRERAHELDLPIVAATEVLYHQPAKRRLQDVLTCIRLGTTLAEAGTRLHENGEHDLKAPAVMAKHFADDPASLARTLEVAERCTFSLDEIRYRYPSERLPTGMTSSEWLRLLSYEGAKHRYGDKPLPKIMAQIDKELELIDELDYCGYFLTMYEIVRFCNEQKILCQGRGSAANSVVCFCLGITAIDPIRLDLLFERFLSRERAEPPDIDLDISHERREEVIQHVYEKYGRSYAAMVANVIRYRSRSAVRDVAKVLGLDEAQTAIAKRDTNSLLYALVSELRECPRHLSIHPGGFLLGHEPVCDLVPIENATMENRTVIQWDKYDVEALGLFKVDLLGLGALTLIDHAFHLIDDHQGIHLSLSTIPPADKGTFDMLCAGDTIGVFQVESRAQMSMLPRLKPRVFYDLVVEVSLVRPGPITGGMVHPYLRRREGKEEITYPHECLRPVLAKTLGVPLFQEQVMKLAVVAADYTPGEADQLRRDMAAWKSAGRIEQHRERLVSRMMKKGIEPEFAERVFEQIRGFGEYGFPESHAASFALIAYITAYLKHNYLAEFTCALLNAQPMGFYSPATIVEDARRHGLEVRPIAVDVSDWDCTLEEGSLRMGIRYVKGVGEEVGRHLMALRQKAPFVDLADFVRRMDDSKRVLDALAEAGALTCFGENRRQSLWAVRGFTRSQEDDVVLASTETLPAFRPLDPLEAILWDYARSGHSTRGHPLGPLRPVLTRMGFPDSRAISQMKHGQRLTYAGLVICRQRPSTASGVIFMTLEDETGFVNLVVWPSVSARFSELVEEASFVAVAGKLQVEGLVIHLVAERFWVPSIPKPARVPLETKSRDFQ